MLDRASSGWAASTRAARSQREGSSPPPKRRQANARNSSAAPEVWSTSSGDRRVILGDQIQGSGHARAGQVPHVLGLLAELLQAGIVGQRYGWHVANPLSPPAVRIV